MEWLSQIILYFSYELLGWHGLVIVTALTITVTFVLMYRLLASKLRATVALGISAVSFIFASLTFWHVLICCHIRLLFYGWPSSPRPATKTGGRVFGCCR